ncbi:queuosine precursor transporter [Vulcanisaeta thermophila]|uniref:queuosine precursor transporter n=1 Tax=Vulcanisaeta thermophila TaxID=867917 RepID=UPI000A03B9F5|nr:queuosine precursor transporter [Vulcanisaeta thermophila]
MLPILYFILSAVVVYMSVALILWAVYRLGGDYALLMASVVSYVTLLVISEYVAVKLMNIGFAVIPAGTATYSSTVASLDILALKYGRRVARTVVWSAAALLIIVFMVNELVIYAPTPPFAQSMQYVVETAFGTSARIAIASVTAFLVAETLDVYLVTKWPWLGVIRRVAISDPISMAVDSLVFTPIAFLGIYPLTAVMSIALGQIMAKVTLVPLTMAAVYINRRALKYGYQYLTK